METICLQCGDRGFTNAFVYCVKCLQFAVHRYCLDVIPENFDEFVHWVCDDCKIDIAKDRTVSENIELISVAEKAIDKSALGSEEHAYEGGSSRLSHAELDLAGCAESSCEDSHRKSDLNNGEDAPSIVAEGCRKRHQGSALKEDADAKDAENAEDVKMKKLHKNGAFAQSHEVCTNEEKAVCSGVDLEEERYKTCSDKTPGAHKGLDLKNHALQSGRHSGGREAEVEINRQPADNCHEHAQPVIEPVWRGVFNIWNTDSEIVELVAHLSSKACDKVCEEAKRLDIVLHLEMIPKTNVWPKSFQTVDPTDENIALYFFPSDSSHEQVFDHLVDEMMCKDLALRAYTYNAELLVFTSTELPLLYWRFQSKYYLWGVFRAKRPPSSHDVNNHLSGPSKLDKRGNSNHSNDNGTGNHSNDNGTGGSKTPTKIQSWGGNSPLSPLSNSGSYSSPCSPLKN